MVRRLRGDAERWGPVICEMKAPFSGAAVGSFSCDLGREFFNCCKAAHTRPSFLRFVSSNFNNQPPKKKEITHPPKNENEGKFPRTLKCNFGANAEMETEIHFLLCRSKRRDVFPQNLTLPPSCREQEIQVCRTLRHSHSSGLGREASLPCRVKAIGPHPSPRAPLSCSHPTGPRTPNTVPQVEHWPIQEMPFPSAAV